VIIFTCKYIYTQNDFEIAVRYLELAINETTRLKSLGKDVPLQDLVVESYAYNQLGLAYEKIGKLDLAENAFLKG
jgi:NADH:ubiquinone oxidoreductase subunit F (NADH-binding)